MDADRQADELICRCAALVIFYHHLDRTRPDKAAMRAEFKAAGDDARKSGLRFESVSSRVLAELNHRYEQEMAVRLHCEFAEAFGLAW